MTNSQRRIRMNNDLAAQLTKIGLRATAEHLDDFIARATTKRLAPRAILEQITEAEMADRATRNLQRLLKQARIGRFKPISDFDWDWPKKIDRELVERALTLDFISEARNLILLGANVRRSPCKLTNPVISMLFSSSTSACLRRPLRQAPPISAWL